MFFKPTSSIFAPDPQINISPLLLLYSAIYNNAAVCATTGAAAMADDHDSALGGWAALWKRQCMEKVLLKQSQ
jgi:hypothetical protein